jgi:cytochrome b subunit of formate dehydrogenase
MSNSRSRQLWLVNVIAFILFFILSITGLINWLVLPRGSRAGSGFLVSLRHFIRDVHTWTALGLIIVVTIHLFLHWDYIKANLKRYGMLK